MGACSPKIIGLNYGGTAPIPLRGIRVKPAAMMTLSKVQAPLLSFYLRTKVTSKNRRLNFIYPPPPASI